MSSLPKVKSYSVSFSKLEPSEELNFEEASYLISSSELVLHLTRFLSGVSKLGSSFCDRKESFASV